MDQGTVKAMIFLVVIAVKSDVFENLKEEKWKFLNCGTGENS